MRRLPSLNALRVLEVAARAESYAEAAMELGVTHGAVSRQVALLEDRLGTKLFIREGRRMIATATARILAAEVRLSFDRLASAVEASSRPGTRRILRVSAPTSFAMRWLIPRLARFHAGHPSVEVVVTTVSTVFEDVRGGVDVAVRRGIAGAHGWPRHRAVAVLDDVDTLIMSPKLFARRPIRTAADIEGHMLLASATRAGDWADWLAAAGLGRLADAPRHTLDHFFVTRQAVIDGLGIGIGPLPLLAIDIAGGALLTPLPDIRVPRTGYVAVIPEQVEAGSPVTAFVDWLVAARHEKNAVAAEAVEAALENG